MKHQYSKDWLVKVYEAATIAETLAIRGVLNSAGISRSPSKRCPLTSACDHRVRLYFADAAGSDNRNTTVMSSSVSTGSPAKKVCW